MPIYKNSISQIVMVIIALVAVIFSFSFIASAEVIEKDLGVVLYTQAPKTWTIDVPQNINKVEIGVYAKGQTEVNQYGGWNGYLKLNGQYVWKFVRHDTKLGGIIYDYINGAEVLETTGRGKWLDVTGKISAGGNTVTFYHYTGGDGIGVKVRIYTTAAITQTPTSTPTKTYTPTPTPTKTPAITSTPAKTPTPIPTLTPATGASISLSGMSSSYNAGDTLSATAYVKNTGGSSHTFPVGFSVRDPDGNWIDIPYKKVTLSPGSGGYVYFTYNIPASGSGGQWSAKAAVWDSETTDGKLSTRYDSKEQAFIALISLTTPKPTQTVPGKYTREGPKTIEEQIRIQCESSDPSEVSLFKISEETGYICSKNAAYKVFKITLRTVDPHETPIRGVEVYKQVFDKRTEIIFDIAVGMATGWALGQLQIPTKILTAMDVKDILELPGKIKLFVEGEFLIIGKTDSNGYIEAWIKENKEIRFKAVGQNPTTIGPVVETDHSIRKVLSGYPWTGDVTITASSPKTGNLQLRRGANVVVVYEKGEDGVSELKNFFKEEFRIEIIKMTFETLKEGKNRQNPAAHTNINNADIFIYLLTAEDAPSSEDYTYDRFMPTFKTSGFFSRASIVDENGIEYRDKSNGVVSYQYNGRNYYLIAGMGNEGLKSAIDAFKRGEWKTVVGPEPVTPTPARKRWWWIW